MSREVIGSPRVYRQLLQVIKAAGLSRVFPRARLLTLTIKHPGHETFEIRVQGRAAPAERIIELQFLAEDGERQPLNTQDVLRMDATGVVSPISRRFYNR